MPRERDSTIFLWTQLRGIRLEAVSHGKALRHPGDPCHPSCIYGVTADLPVSLLIRHSGQQAEPRGICFVGPGAAEHQTCVLLYVYS